MIIDERIEDIIEEMKCEMREERYYADIFLAYIKERKCDYAIETSRRLMSERIQYIGGLADALRHLGLKVEFDAEIDKKYDNVIFFKDVKVE